MTQARAWAGLRALYMQMTSEWYANAQDPTVLGIATLMKTVWPVHIPNPETDGDMSYVYFSDGSTIKYDWDNGDFEVEDIRLDYPHYITDPLFWKD